jgi:hypothetical protein
MWGRSLAFALLTLASLAGLVAPLIVALGFSLVDAPNASTEGFETQEEFERQLDSSPPSLHLFKAGDRHHLSATVRTDPLPQALTSQLPDGTKSFLLQWVAEDGDHRRSVFVQA